MTEENFGSRSDIFRILRCIVRSLTNALAAHSLQYIIKGNYEIGAQRLKNQTSSCC